MATDTKPSSASVAPKQTSPEEPRTPKRGDTIIFRGWGNDDNGLHAVAAHCVADKVTLAYLSRSGSWLSGHLVPFDPSGQTPGSWRWPA